MSGPSEASSPDYEQDWDALEQQSMKVLDQKLQELQAPSASSAQGSSLATSSSPPDDVRRMQQAISREPYRPEDHQFTSEEMWAGFSSEEEGEPAQSSQEKGVEEEPESKKLEEQSKDFHPEARARVDEGKAAMRETMMGHFERACMQEPYRPEDHHLSVEEFWGGSDSSRGSRSKVEHSVGQEDLEASTRLQRMLAGDRAPQALADLDFQQLDALTSSTNSSHAFNGWIGKAQPPSLTHTQFIVIWDSSLLGSTLPPESRCHSQFPGVQWYISWCCDLS
ncbi:unnamed protein product [Effrenium voratum]|nr:unnamed protein product [Effrenium voratum]